MHRQYIAAPGAPYGNGTRDRVNQRQVLAGRAARFQDDIAGVADAKGDDLAWIGGRNEWYVGVDAIEALRICGA